MYVRKNQLEGLWTEEKRNTNPEINNFVPCVSGEGFGCPDIMSNNYLPVRTGDLHGGDIGQCGRPGATLYDLQEECFNNPDCIAVTTTRSGSPWCMKSEEKRNRNFNGDFRINPRPTGGERIYIKKSKRDLFGL